MKKTEICQQCGADYTPKRRGAQKFCNNSCRSRHWQLKQYTEKKDIVIQQDSNPTSQKLKVEKMSVAGVANATVGTGVVELAKHALGIAPATKKDIQELKTLIKGRLLRVNNMDNDAYGRSPFYEVQTGNLVYL